MSWSKRQFVEAAFAEIGLGAYNFDLSPEMLQVGLERLDSMMATWNARGFRLAYPIPADAKSGDLDEITNVPDSANEAIYQNLALRIAPVFGKVVSMELKQAAMYGYNAMISKNAKIPEMQLNQTVPAGAGSKYKRNYDFMLDKPEDRLEADNSGLLDFY